MELKWSENVYPNYSEENYHGYQYYRGSVKMCSKY